MDSSRAIVADRPPASRPAETESRRADGPSGGLLASHLRHRLGRAARAIGSILYTGDSFYCPCCESRLRRFRCSAGDTNQSCPACGSLERQRLLILYLANHFHVFTLPFRVLHFAPEPCLYDRLKRASLLDYVTADIERMPMVDVQLDITEMPWDNASFDLIICSHVLEHVEDDDSALREMRRVLRPSGKALLQHPIDPQRERTWESPSIVDPAGRLEAFGQEDHVRRYGRDFADRVAEVGFEVERVPLVDQLPSETVHRLGLRDRSPIRADDLYVCAPNA